MTEHIAPSMNHEPPQRRIIAPTLWLILILIAGVGVRYALSLRPRVVWGDEPVYLWLARNWFSGQEFQILGAPDVHHGPGLPALVGGLYLLTGDLFLSSSLVYLITGALLVLPVYAIAARIYRPTVGLLAALLVALYPALTTLLLWGTMTEPPYLLAVYTALYLALVGFEENKPFRLLLAGILIGFAYLIRQEAMLYVLTLGGFGVLYLTLRQRWERRGALALILLVLGFATSFVPYTYYVYQNTGEWMLSEKAGVAFATTGGLAYGDTRAFDQATWGLDETGLMVYFYSDQRLEDVGMLQAILADPRGFARLVYVNMQRFFELLFGPRLLPGYLAALVVVGLLRTPWDRQRTWRELYLALAAAPVLAFLFFFVQDRYLIPAIPVLLIWLALGIWELCQWLHQTVQNILADRRGRWIRLSNALSTVAPALLIVMLVAATTPGVLQASTRVRSFQPEHREIGFWLRGQGVTGSTTVMARYPAIAFHANARWVPTPAADVADVLRYADHHQAQIWVIDSWEADDLRPQFAEIFYHPERAAPAGWEAIYRMPARDGDILVLRRTGSQSARTDFH